MPGASSEAVLSRPAGEATLYALADRCVQCGLCLPHCPTYGLDRSESESPRGRIAYIRAVAGGSLAPTEVGDVHLDHCLGCRRCEGACPAGVEYGLLLLGAREAQFSRLPPPPRIRRRLWLLARPRLLSALLGVYRLLHPWLPRAWRPLPRPPARAPSAPDPGSGPVLFVGCVANAYEGPARAALRRLFEAAGLPVGEPAAQACCGAAAAHAGDAGAAARLGEANRRAFRGRERVFCLASGCQPTLSASLEGVAGVEDPMLFLARHADGLRFRSAGGRRVALHRPCSQFALAGSIGAMRSLLARIPDLDLVELPDRGCCGAAGLHMQQFPDRAQALAQPLHRDLEQSGASELLSANVGCRLHLDDGKVRVRHPLELLAELLA